MSAFEQGARQPGHAEAARRHLAALTGFPFITAQDLVEATQDAESFVQLAGVSLSGVAVNLLKICNDLRLLSSRYPPAVLRPAGRPRRDHPAAGPGRVQHHARRGQPRHSRGRQPGRLEVIGHDVTITLAAAAGQLQLNAFEPIIVRSLFESLSHLRAGCQILAQCCVQGMGANSDQLQYLLARSLGIVTALTPEIGYADATAPPQESMTIGRSIKDLVLAHGLLTSTLSRTPCAPGIPPNPGSSSDTATMGTAGRPPGRPAAAGAAASQTATVSAVTSGPVVPEPSLDREWAVVSVEHERGRVELGVALCPARPGQVRALRRVGGPKCCTGVIHQGGVERQGG